MKKISTTAKIILALITITLTISACKKDFNNGDQIEAAGVGFVHASPTLGALDFVIDNQKGGTFTYGKDLGYYAAYPGSRLIGVVKKDSTRYLGTSNVNLAAGSFYSVFMVDTLNRAKVLVIKDDLKAPETGKAKIRFINLSPDAPAMDLAIVGQTAPIFATKAYKQYSDFTAVAPSDSYSFQLRESSTAAVKVTLPNVKIESGKIYTIWAKGLASKTDTTTLALSIMTNK